MWSMQWFQSDVLKFEGPRFGPELDTHLLELGLNVSQSKTH